MADYKNVVFRTKFTINRKEEEFLWYDEWMQNQLKREYFKLRNELVNELNPRYAEWNAKAPKNRLAYEIYIYRKQKEVARELYEKKWKHEYHPFDLDIEFWTDDIVGRFRGFKDVIRCELTPVWEES